MAKTSLSGHSIISRKAIVLALSIFSLMIVLSAGCSGKKSVPGDINDTTVVMLGDLEEPYFMNLDEFRIKLTKVGSFQFNYSDTEVPDNNNYYYVKGNRMSAVLPEVRYHYGDVPYDMVFFFKGDQKAFGWCSKRTCKDWTDGEAEEINYTDYDITTPAQLGYSFKNLMVHKREMIGNHVCLVAKFEDFDHNNGTVWIQSHYMIPLKAEYDDGRVIEYKKMYWNTVRDYYVDLPIIVQMRLSSYMAEHPYANLTISQKDLDDFAKAMKGAKSDSGAEDTSGSTDIVVDSDTSDTNEIAAGDAPDNSGVVVAD